PRRPALPTRRSSDLSRALPAALMHVLPPTRADGLSAGAGTVSQETALIGAVIGAVSLLTLGPGAALAALLLLIAMLAGFAALCRDRKSTRLNSSHVK